MTNLKNQILNRIQLQGKKRTSEKIVFKSIKAIQKQFLKNSKLIIKSAIISSSPVTQIKKIRRKRRKTTEFPVILKRNLRLSSGIQYLIKYSKKKSPQSFHFNFVLEIINSSKYKSNSVSQKEHIHESSFINKKYASYRWF